MVSRESRSPTPHTPSEKHYAPRLWALPPRPFCFLHPLHFLSLEHLLYLRRKCLIFHTYCVNGYGVFTMEKMGSGVRYQKF